MWPAFYPQIPPAVNGRRGTSPDRSEVIYRMVMVTWRMLRDLCGSSFGGGSRNRTGVHGFAGRCMTTLPSRLAYLDEEGKARITPVEPSLASWSGKRVSNSRPQPWQGCALPTELFPRSPELYQPLTFAWGSALRR